MNHGLKFLGSLLECAWEVDIPVGVPLACVQLILMALIARPYYLKRKEASRSLLRFLLILSQVIPILFVPVVFGVWLYKGYDHCQTRELLIRVHWEIEQKRTLAELDHALKDFSFWVKATEPFKTRRPVRERIDAARKNLFSHSFLVRADANSEYLHSLMEARSASTEEPKILLGEVEVATIVHRLRDGRELTIFLIPEATEQRSTLVRGVPIRAWKIDTFEIREK